MRIVLLTVVTLLVLTAMVAIVTQVIVEGRALADAPSADDPAGAFELSIFDNDEDADADAAADAATSSEAGSFNDAADEGPTSAAVTPRVQQVALNGQDVADLLDIRAWRFDYELPADDYTAHVYLERWTRDAEEPERQSLLTQPVLAMADSILLRLPTRQDTAMYVAVGSAVARSDDAEPVDIPRPTRIDVLNEQDIDLDQPVHLVTLTHNLDSRATGGLQDVHRDHDVTVYVKVRFIAGDAD